ncbi:hypothetical protein MMC21_001975 [Puttea exsequens]|nr:hypothetical protein [Puttea exsequens]
MPSLQSTKSNTLGKRSSWHLAAHANPPTKRFKTTESRGRLGSTERFKADKWFNDTNKDASGMNNVSFQDNDPPFYVGRPPSSSNNSACAVRSSGSDNAKLSRPTAPTRALLARMESSERGSEDFRSVIDDLTIQNKKLKKKLKKYEKLHCSQLQEEKLFEVRIHGLAAHRKRELEQTLRNFASSLEDDVPGIPPIAPLPLKQNSLTEPPSSLHKPSSPSTSCSKPIDSAYASMSGQTGTSHSQQPEQTKYQSQSKQQNVQSYLLHDLPETLMPRHSSTMSEKSKSKLVVRRLEQIFTGKGAARRHTQSQQQQEVSKSAALADRSKLEVGGSRGRRPLKEGVREAHILPSDLDMQLESLEEISAGVSKPRRSDDGRASSRSTDFSRDASPEQRPTRPLDLDLHRAQVPSENFEYIKHLGVPQSTVAENVGWVYLNLLSSMAQLHTLNVTPEFIRHAVAEVSAKFELSSDSTKVRWLGGTEGTKMSSDEDEESEYVSNYRSETSLSVSKQGSATEISSSQEPKSAQLPESLNPPYRGKRRPVAPSESASRAKFHYEPLFHHTTSNDSDSIQASAPSSFSDAIENTTGLNSGFNSGSHGLRESEARLSKQNRDNGPIIFYHKARFCTDLSGDPTGTILDENAIQRITDFPLGSPVPVPNAVEEEFENCSNDENCHFEPMDLALEGSLKISSSLDLHELKSSIHDLAPASLEPSLASYDMEASGLGGVHPSDNFIVKVEVQYDSANRTLQKPKPKLISRTWSRHLANEWETLASKRAQPSVGTQIVSVERMALAPSSLPQPSFLCIPFSESGSEAGHGSEDTGPSTIPFEAKSKKLSLPPSVGGECLKPISRSSSEETKESSYFSSSSGGDGDDDDDDDSSIDLLAHARVLDPHTIAKQEREFDQNAARIPLQPLSGSLAMATAGETSGDLSQTSGLSRKMKDDSSDIDSMGVDGDDDSMMGRGL